MFRPLLFPTTYLVWQRIILWTAQSAKNFFWKPVLAKKFFSSIEMLKTSLKKPQKDIKIKIKSLWADAFLYGRNGTIFKLSEMSLSQPLILLFFLNSQKLNFTTKNLKKLLSSIECQDSNQWLLNDNSPPVTSGPISS